MKNKEKQTGKQFVFPDQFFLSFERKLYIMEEISDSLYEKLEKALAILNKEKGDINVVINSNGGNYFAGKNIYNMFQKSPNPIIGIAGENISSVAAVLVLQGCKLRLVKKETQMSLHNIRQELGFQFVPFKTDKRLSHQTIEKYLKKAEQHQIFIYKVLATRTQKSKEKMAKLLLKEPTLSAREILKYGLADRFARPQDCL